ncbi:MAG: GNAT family N-acetyltransferase [Caldilinea sp. CFX5]|nr:GNAT family N-acetyltransferase [Caldilinea sp. CFX5]
MHRDLKTTPIDFNQAIEATLIHEWRQCLGQLAGGEVYDGADLKWSLTGASHMNAVFGARLTAENIAARVQQVQAHFGQRKIEYFAWVIGPSTQPADLGDQLVSHYGAHALDGWRSVELTGMALELDQLPKHIPSPPAVTIERVTTADAFDEWVAVAEGHPVRQQIMRDLFLRAGFGQQPSLYAYLARRQGALLAAVSVFDGSLATALRSVDVLPEARRQGLATWLCWVALDEARQRGQQLAVTDATAMGYGVYQRLGFQACCPIFEYACRVPALA